MSSCKTCGRAYKHNGECSRCLIYRRRNGKARPPTMDRLPRSDKGKPRPHTRKKKG